MKVAICDYQAGNLKALAVTLSRLGFDPFYCADAKEALRAPAVILPGVGAANYAMQRLNKTGLSDAIKQRFSADRFTLGICLGMQLLVDSSAEDGQTPCLGLLRGTVSEITSTARSPRMGWAKVDPWGKDFWFAHSYAVSSEYVTATSEGIAAAIENRALMGVQFHPEKSGQSGEEFLKQCLTNA